jgi:hypothetical protein
MQRLSLLRSLQLGFSFCQFYSERFVLPTLFSQANRQQYQTSQRRQTSYRQRYKPASHCSRACHHCLLQYFYHSPKLLKLMPCYGYILP